MDGHPCRDEETRDRLAFIALNAAIAVGWAAALSFVLPVSLPLGALAVVTAPFVGWALGIALDWRLPVQAQGTLPAVALIVLGMGLWIAVVFAVARAILGS